MNVSALPLHEMICAWEERKTCGNYTQNVAEMTREEQ